MEPKTSSANPWTVPCLAIGAVMAARDACIVDLRSPSEFAADHLPGAHNLPLFDDAERALIGTLYKKSSPQAAFDAGRQVVLDHISQLVGELARLANRAAPTEDLGSLVERLTQGGIRGVNEAMGSVAVSVAPPAALVVHCWRGGMRSSSLVALLRELGWNDCFILEGGYKSYRTDVLRQLDGWKLPPSFILRGPTGVGKTLVLREMERQRPGLTLDLEGLAGHRSSILGMVGLSPCSQKVFDSRLAERLRSGFPDRVAIEGESRKVGDSIVPASVWNALQEGVHLELHAPVEHRVQVLIDDYLADDRHRAELRGQLPFIEGRLGSKKWAGELVGLLDAGREAELTEILLERYYDPLYEHSEKGRNYTARFDTSDVEGAAVAIIDWIEAYSRSK